MTIIGPTMTIIGPTTIVIGWTEPCASSHLVAVFDPAVHEGRCSHAECSQEFGGFGGGRRGAFFPGRLAPAPWGLSGLLDRVDGGCGGRTAPACAVRQQAAEVCGRLEPRVPGSKESHEA
jgi:hypothetical protein